MSTVYFFAWGNNPKRKTMKGRACIVISRGRMNIEFIDNGQRKIVSRNSIQKHPHFSGK